jgi:hypothetical protein
MSIQTRKFGSFIVEADRVFERLITQHISLNPKGKTVRFTVHKPIVKLSQLASFNQ